jgi:hypothetical protein
LVDQSPPALKGRVQVAPVGDDDVARVAGFLHAHLNPRIPATEWASSLDVPWEVDPPNAGFMLVDDETVVGVQLAFYAERLIDGQAERFCNLGAWCVLPDYRFHSIRLLRAVLSQEGYHFTDLSPSGNVPAINSRLNFHSLDTTTALVLNLPWPTVPGRARISSDPEVIERTLTGRELELYRDHRSARAALHSVVIDGDDWCYVIYRKDRRKNLPLFVSVLHVSNPDLFRRQARRFTRHVLVRRRALATLAEERVVGHLPRPSVRLRSPRPKMFRSADLQPAQIDYLYSELVCVPW